MGNVTDRVEEVLRDAGKSLHYKEITEQMVERGWQTKGLTPWRTVNAPHCHRNEERRVFQIRSHGQRNLRHKILILQIKPIH